MAVGTIRYWAAAREAAGCAEEPFRADTLAGALEGARSSRPPRFEAVLGRSSYLVDGDPVGTRKHDAVRLHDGAVIEVLPPFAGGWALPLAVRMRRCAPCPTLPPSCAVRSRPARLQWSPRSR